METPPTSSKARPSRHNQRSAQQHSHAQHQHQQQQQQQQPQHQQQPSTTTSQPAAATPCGPLSPSAFSGSTCSGGSTSAGQPGATPGGHQYYGTSGPLTDAGSTAALGAAAGAAVAAAAGTTGVAGTRRRASHEPASHNLDSPGSASAGQAAHSLSNVAASLQQPESPPPTDEGRQSRKRKYNTRLASRGEDSLPAKEVQPTQPAPATAHKDSKGLSSPKKPRKGSQSQQTSVPVIVGEPVADSCCERCNEPMESQASAGSANSSSSSSAGGGTSGANNNQMDAQSASAASTGGAYGEGGSGGGAGGGGSGEDGDVNRLRELLESRGIPPQLLGTLGPRMQHFLHRYVGSIGGVSNLSNGNHSRATQLLETLQSPDENEQLGAVMEMCQTLVMGNEDSLAGFPFKTVIPALVGLLAGPAEGAADGRAPNFEVMHNACRALTYMMEALPRSTSLIAESIPRFVEKLEAIQCVDVAEQSLTALEMLSKKHAKAILHANGVASCLAYLDFFSMNAQRSALTITANCCAHLGPDDWSLVKPCVPLLAQRLDPGGCDNPDKKSIDCACAALSRIVEAFQNNADVLEEVAPRSTLDLIQALVLRNPPLVSSPTFVIVIRMLALLCQGCPSIAVELLKSNIDVTLRHLLVGPEKDGRVDPPELLARSPQELYEITGLIMELMPRLPDDGVFVVDQMLWTPQGQQMAVGATNNVITQVHWCWQDNNMEWQPYSLVDGRCIESAHANGEEEVSLSINGKTYALSFTQMQQTSEDSGTTRAIRRTVSSCNQTPGLAAGAASGQQQATCTGSSAQTIATSTPQQSDKGSTTKTASAAGAAAATEGCGVLASAGRDARAELVKAEPELVAKFVRSLMSVLYEVYGSSAGPAVRHKCLRAMLRIVYYTDAATLEGILRADAVSNHLSQMLSTHNDLRVTVMALQLTEILMQKMPHLFVHSFNREGVIHKIAELSSKPVEPLESHISSAAPHVHNSAYSGHRGVHGPADATEFAIAPASHGGPGGAHGEPTTSAEKSPEHQHNQLFSQRFLGDMLKRKRTSGAAAANDKKRASESRGKDSRRMKGSSAGGSASASAGAPESKRGGPATRSRLSVHGDLESPEEIAGGHGANSAKPSSSGHSSAQGSSNSSPVSMRFSSTPSAQPAASCSGQQGSGGGADRHNSIQQQLQRQRQEMVYKIKLWIRDESQSLNDNYFATYRQQLCRSTLEKLESAVALVKAGQEDSGKLVQGLKDICEVLQQGDVSSFELIHSGMVAALLDLFAEPGSEAFVGNAKIILQVFAGVDVLLNACEPQSGPCTVGDPTPLLTLVSRLSSCVSQLEQFALKVHDVPGGIGGTRGTSALRFFNTHQLKCNLERHPSCANLKQWKNGPVKIDPLALVQAIERYLVVRGYGRVRDDDECGSEDDNSDEDLDESMLLGSSQGHSRHRLQFLIGETPLQYNMTVYQAIKQYSHLADGGAYSEADLFDVSLGLDSASSAVWTHTHTIYYRPAIADESGQNGTGQRKSKSKGSGGKKQMPKDELWNEGFSPSPTCPIEDALVAGRSLEAKLSDPSLRMLALLRLLYALSQHWGLLYGVHNFIPALQEEVFLNAKLSNKALRQLQDPLALMTGNIPPWLKTLSAFCPFIMPFKTRHNLFYSTCFDRDRALQRLMDSSPELSSGDSSERVTPRLDRKKRTVNRDDLLKQAEVVFNEISLSNSRAMLEIQYDNEVGSGLGPTLEFYTLVSRELQRCDLEMWRNSMTSTDRALYQKGGEKKYVFCPGGLYPSPVARNIKSSQLNKIKNRFKMCGKFVAKALMDSRMLDMQFSVPLFKWMLGEERSLGLRDIQYIDEQLFRHLCKLQSLVEQKNRIIAQNKNLTGPAMSKSLEKLTLDGCSVELLGLDFTLPGYDIELKKGGANVAVTIHNLDQYIRLVVYWTLVEGVRRQMDAFKEGFESIFPMDSLGHYFRPNELNRALCGDSAYWSMDVLRTACKIDHGYTVDSRAIQFLFQIMEEFDESQRRQFLLFATGSPRLPVGGFHALVPPFTIVKKSSEGHPSDKYLPSVMTCVNYFKLPDYSSKEVMKEKLLVAQSEGQCSFHLS
ncbi:putative E3 ubiquitin-protein ligase TRIP12-like [Tropilaelaps mercedesae]|uniref:E3 ubiquitin-protein ligase n=1 Tax=Tropilaelaps mercedesae TaxID=418985 RepID=A0A1V9XTV0_9ACAR|nr:putative E3 ubiquitin-protein ligase TRIP12-like [Tropilaelaps mercedesae]